jgi:hypothetical protein
MGAMDEAKRVLLAAEESLRNLVASAAANGDYDAIVELAEWARTVRSLGDNINSTKNPTIGHNGNNGSLDGPATISGSRRSRKEYPLFFRDSNFLVKVAKSKSERTEYEHKAPKSVIGQLAHALTKANQRNRLITMDSVLPLKDADGDDVPSYQSYLCLAWLKYLGLVRQHGRQGYSVSPNHRLEEEITAAWEALPLSRKP